MSINNIPYKKTIDRKYSHRFIARELSLSSKGWFADLLAGRLNLVPSHRIKLARILGLTESEER